MLKKENLKSSVKERKEWIEVGLVLAVAAWLTLEPLDVDVGLEHHVKSFVGEGVVAPVFGSCGGWLEVQLDGEGDILKIK